MIFRDFSSLPISCGSQRRKRRDRRAAMSADSNNLGKAPQTMSVSASPLLAIEEGATL